MLKRIAFKISHDNRTHKFNLFMKQFNPSPKDSLLDVGPAGYECDTKANMLEKLYPHRHNITALGIDNFEEFNQRYPDIKTITYDGSIFPFDNKKFDYIWSNAVLEHVGNFEKQVSFIKEIKRTSNHAMITTPNRYFPFEVHTKCFLIHFLPKKIFDKILFWIDKSWASGNYMHLLSKGQIEKLLKDAGIKDFKIQSNKIYGFTMDYCIFF